MIADPWFFSKGVSRIRSDLRVHMKRTRTYSGSVFSKVRKFEAYAMLCNAFLSLANIRLVRYFRVRPNTISLTLPFHFEKYVLVPPRI